LIEAVPVRSSVLALQIVLSLEELIEKARYDVVHNAKTSGVKLTPVNATTFMAWKKRKIVEKKAALKALKKKTKAKLETGKATGVTCHVTLPTTLDFLSPGGGWGGVEEDVRHALVRPVIPSHYAFSVPPPPCRSAGRICSALVPPSTLVFSFSWRKRS